MKKRFRKSKKGFVNSLIFILVLFLILVIVLLIYNYLGNKEDKNKELKGTLKNLKINQLPENLQSESEDFYNDFDLTDNTLILYNLNTAESQEIAEYYANKRGINSSFLCPIKIFPGQYAKWSEFLGMRKTIIDNCLCSLIPADKFSKPCNIDNQEELSRYSPITHLVIIKGIPPRLTGTPFPYDYEDPSLDFYLSISLYQNLSKFSNWESLINDSLYSVYYHRRYRYLPQKSTANGVYGYVRPINTSLDKIIAYGRVEEMTKQRTFDLIDHTIEVENKGISGNFLASLDGNQDDSLRLYNFFLDLSSSRKNECMDYMSSDTLPWPYENCRAGFVKNGNIPGEVNTNILKAINTGIYLGASPWPNSQSGFDGFDNMLRWRKSQDECIALCKDIPDPLLQSECKDNSTDYFKEINTDCVGGADGMIGWQFRSYPVQYFGFWPSGIGPGYDDGSIEKTPPIILNGDSYKDSKFSDDNYLHFGSLDSVLNPDCILENGTNKTCYELLGISLSLSSVVKIIPQENTTLELKFRHRNPVNDNKKIFINLNYYLSDGTMKSLSSQTIDISEENPSWKLVNINFSMNNTHDKNITSIYLYFNSYISSAPENWFDIDGIELIDTNTLEDLIDISTGSFNKSSIGYTYGGDFASNFIARIGGIGFFGCSSHFATNGGAFNFPADFAGTFYSGRTYGESLAYISRYAMSGIIYGDPLYRPSGVKIFMNHGLTSLNNRNSPFHVLKGAENIPQIFINAFHGQENLNTTNWALSICPDDNITNCDLTNNWTIFESGMSAVYNYPIKTNISQLLNSYYSNDHIAIKLRIWNPGDEYNDLTNYAYFAYCSCECPSLSCNNNNGCNYTGYCETKTCLYNPVEENSKDTRIGIECNLGFKNSTNMNNNIDYFCTAKSGSGECAECINDSFCNDNDPMNGYEACDITGDGIGDCETWSSYPTTNITTCDELQLIWRNFSDNYYLMNNIDFSKCSSRYNSGKGFVPIGTLEKPFTGKFDGQGHSIINLFINKSSEDYAGLFGYVNKSEIKNIRVVSSNIIGKSHTGGIVGYNKGGNISDCIFTGNVTGNAYVGGLIGSNLGRVSKSYSSANINGFFYVGGLVGDNYENISYSYSVSNITGRTQLGGLVGNGKAGRILNSFSNSNISGVGFIGGFIGYCSGFKPCIIMNSYSKGNVNGNNFIGGFLGYTNGLIINSYSVTNVFGNNTIGGFISENRNIINNSFYDIDNVICRNLTGGCKTDFNISHVNLINISYLALHGWDFNNSHENWSMPDNESYPELLGLEKENFCGDLICNNDESCNSCSIDCYCDDNSNDNENNGNNGNNGNTQASTSTNITKNKSNPENLNIIKEKCLSNLSCDWGPCINKTQVWKCIDLNNCTKESPAKIRFCISDKKATYLYFIIIFVIAFIIILIILLFIKKYYFIRIVPDLKH